MSLTDQELAQASLPELYEAARITRAAINEADKAVQLAYEALSAAQARRAQLLAARDGIYLMIGIREEQKR